MIDEAERQKKVLNMMITAHSILRDRYSRLSALFENGLLVASVVLNALVFVDSTFITKVSTLTEDVQKLIVGIVSIVVFAVSVVLLQVKWKEKSENHSKTIIELFSLLQELRGILNIDTDNERKQQFVRFNEKYVQVSSRLTPIPDAQFNGLKLIHKRKVELSKLIDKQPGSPMFFLRIKLFISSFK